jgi:uridine kinase
MHTQTFKELGEKILTIKSKYSEKLIAIDGGGGAGKSTFAKHLQKCVPNSVIIHTDDFYKGPWDKRLDHRNYEIHPFFDWDRFDTEVMRPIEEGQQIQYHVYDWHAHTTDKVVSVPLDATIIIEGGSVTQKRFFDRYDFKIWIEANEGTRLKQALKRDGEHMRFLWEEDWLPVERNYIKKQRPAYTADMVVKGHSGDFSGGAFDVLDADALANEAMDKGA